MAHPTAFNRRRLLTTYPIGAAALYASASVEPAFPLHADGRSPQDVAEDEDFWRQVRAEFELDSNHVRVNLSAGHYNAPPRSVQSAFRRATLFTGAMPNVNRSRVFGGAAREKLRARLATKLGAAPSEIALTRGTTEALNIVAAGAQLRSGDEVLTTNLDYGALKAAWRVRGLRDGIVLKEIPVAHPPESPAELVQALADAFTPRTRMVHVCHVTDINGQIFPIRQICDMAHSRGAQVTVDGALGFGVLPVDLRELDCDYYGTSLHKGMYAPAGTGLLYVRENLVGEVLPLFGAAEPESADIRKFEEIGTSPITPLASVNAALDFHERIGTERISARLHSLKRTWLEMLADAPGVEFHTSAAPDQSCAVANARVGSADPHAVWRYLYDEHGISCYYSTSPFAGMIVRFHVHTSRADVEQCAGLLASIAERGIPEQ